MGLIQSYNENKSEKERIAMNLNLMKWTVHPINQETY